MVWLHSPLYNIYMKLLHHFCVAVLRLKLKFDILFLLSQLFVRYISKVKRLKLVWFKLFLCLLRMLFNMSNPICLPALHQFCSLPYNRSIALHSEFYYLLSIYSKHPW
jgi:hypothetical protein